jgi:hypothetical protein
MRRQVASDAEVCPHCGTNRFERVGIVGETLGGIAQGLWLYFIAAAALFVLGFVAKACRAFGG